LSPNIIQVNKSESILYARHVERIGDTINEYKSFRWKLKVRDHVEDLGVEGSSLLKCI